MKRWVPVLMWAFLGGCYDFDRDYEACTAPGGRCFVEPVPAVDGGGIPDAGAADAGHTDAGPSDAGQPDGGQVMDAGQEPLELGEVCTAAGQCASNHCVDGRCCNRACSGQCEACDVAGSDGTCSPVTGAPHGARAECVGTGTTCGGSCDGVDPTACVYPTVTCRALACSGGTLTQEVACNQGQCPAAMPQTCSIKRCESGTACAKVTQLAAGYEFTCALLSDKTVSCWGRNYEGQLGLGHDNEAPTPTSLPSLSSVKEIAAGYGHACALLEDGTVRCWGANYSGQVGNGVASTTPVLTPVTVPNLSGVNQLALGQGHSCARVQSNPSLGVKCWGENDTGQVGDGTFGADRTSPTTVCLSGSSTSCSQLTNAFDIAAGYQHTCIRGASNSVRCWGANNGGQLGQTPDTSAHPNPLLISNFTTTFVDRGGNFSCGRDGVGALSCWGVNNQGQLGRGHNSSTNRHIPAQVCSAFGASCTAFLTNVSQMEGGESHACALAGGEMRCWGQNGYGQLGDGTINSIYWAGKIPFSSGVVGMATGGYHSCALLMDDTVRCWGWNSSGQVGTGSGQASHLTPVSPAW
jgi:alpha-tubulin suppressor-like RCC1 family protein